MKIKKILAVLSIFCMIGTVVPVLPVQETACILASAEDTYENFQYKKYEDYIEITGYVEEPIGELIVPAEIDGLPVNSIAARAFRDCEEITALTIPDTLTSISSGVFYCDVSGNHSFSSNIENSIKDEAFLNCRNLSAIYVSETHPTFSSEDGILFNKDKTELIRYPAGKQEEAYVIPDSVAKITQYSFSGCQKLSSVTIPNSVTQIEDAAFAYCTALTSITIPDGVTRIEDAEFEGCTSLSVIDIPDSVTSVGRKTFQATPWLEEKQKENPLFIFKDVLNDGTACEGDVIIPDGVTQIESAAFLSSSIASVVIPESVEKIKNQAFAYCRSLNSVTIKSSDCDIYFSNDTLSNAEITTIYGYEGSTAQAYAEKYGYQFALIGSEPETSEPKAEELKQGDADGSGEIDILDVITINKAIMGKENLSENGLKAIDFNGNGKPDSDEALTLLKYIVGIITDFNA